MNWVNKSPGIDMAEMEGFKITRIADMKKPGRILHKGSRELIQVYKYIAIRPGEPVQRFAGADLDKIKTQILSLTVKTLF